MKKFALFLAPLISISFLTSCGAKSGPKQYSVTVGEHEHLSFTTIDGKDLSTIKATEGQDFKFKMKIENASNEIKYLVPTSLDIKINDMPSLASDFYHISASEDEKSAEVSITGSKVIGNILISGNAAITGKYNYKISNHDGLNIDVPSEGGKDALENLIITFTPKTKESSNDTYAKPNAENILIQFDNAPGINPIQWVSPAEAGVGEFCIFDEESGELTIKPKYIKNNIDIKTRSPNYPVLEKMTWKDINGYSFSGYAPYVFYIGEEKLVEVNGLNHRVRIIDFNHDYTDSKKPAESKVGITFEFANLIYNGSDEFDVSWDDENKHNYNFPKSILNKFLNDDDNCVFNMLPNDLKNDGIIKKVNKQVRVSTDEGASYHLTDYTTRLFPLSTSEISKGENEVYQYYDNSNSNIRIKANLKGTEKDYWLRSPFENSKAYAISSLGDFLTYSVQITSAVAPAFCI